MSLFQHLAEIKQRFLRILLVFLLCFIGGYSQSDILYSYLLIPLQDILPVDGQHIMIYTSLQEAFVTYLNLSFYFALGLTMPYALIEIYFFLAPGLYQQEKKKILPFLFSIPCSFFLGSFLAYYFIFPIAFEFFLSFESHDPSQLPVVLTARVSEYLSLSLQIMIAFGLAFQMPQLLILLVNFGLITHENLKEKRKYAVVIIFAVAAIITPPDIISQIGLAVPMILLYEISILLTRSKKVNHA